MIRNAWARCSCLAVALAIPIGMSTAHATSHWRVQHKFDRLDTNGDGVISSDEHAVATRWLHEQADRDGDGDVSQHELGSAPALRRFDADGNGRLTLEELLRGKRTQFDRCDLDGSGTIDPREFTSGHERL